MRFNEYPATRPGSPRELSSVTESDEINLHKVFRRFWRRRTLLLSTILLTMLSAALIMFQLTPRYTAETRILVGIRSQNVVAVEDVLEALRRPDRASLENEVEILTSLFMAEKVVDRLGLGQNPEFNRHLRPPTLLRHLLDWFVSLPIAWFNAGSVAVMTPEETERQIRRDTVAALQEALTVDIVGISRVVAVAATSWDPDLAATIANTLAELYLEEQLQIKLNATQQASAWLNTRVGVLRDQVEQSERELENYRQQHGLIQTNASDTTLIEQQISEISTQLLVAQSETAEAEAKLRQALALLQTEGGVYSVPEVLVAPLIQNLRMEEARLAGEAAQMRSEYGARHPKMIKVETELSNIRARITIEVERIVHGLESSLNVARTRESTLESGLANLKGEITRLAAAQARLRVLERETAANQALFDVFLSRWKETGQQEELQSADAQIISRAVVPVEPSWPSTMVFMSIALLIAIVLAIVLVTLVEEVFDNGFWNVEQLEGFLNLALLGSIPMLPEDNKSIDHVLKEPLSGFTESVRMLYTALLASQAGAETETETETETGAEVILITSSVADEGKTFTSLALARLAASSGSKVLLIDADMRQPTVAERLNLDNTFGLSVLLSRHSISAEEFIQHDEMSGLDVLPAGKVLNLPTTNTLNRQAILRLLEGLKPAYDTIIIDSPPSLMVSSTCTLAQVADKTLFVVRWQGTSCKVAGDGLKRLIEHGAQVIGVTATMVRVNGKCGYPNETYPYGYGFLPKYGNI